MLRRTFLTLLAAVPFVGRKAKEPNVTWKRCGRIPEPPQRNYRIVPFGPVPTKVVGIPSGGSVTLVCWEDGTSTTYTA